MLKIELIIFTTWWLPNSYSVNPFYLLINHTSGYIKEKGANKYLIIDSTDENKELLKNTTMFGMEL